MHLPLLCDRYELRDDVMPGAGRHRGGIGVIKVQRYLTPGFLTHEADRHDDPPWGFRGGTAGRGGRLIKYNIADPGRVEDLPAKIHGLRNQTGDCIGFLGPCGGGYGDPLERPAEQVREDVLDDFCTRAHASGGLRRRSRRLPGARRGRHRGSPRGDGDAGCLGARPTLPDSQQAATAARRPCGALASCAPRAWTRDGAGRRPAAVSEKSLESEAVAEIDAPDLVVRDDIGGRALHQHGALVDDAGAVDDVERLPHIVIREQHADAAVLEVGDEIADSRPPRWGRCLRAARRAA